MSVKKIIIGAVTTIIIGGSAYTVSQTDVINNFAKDTGMTQQQAEQYVKNIDKNDLTSWNKLGQDLITDSKDAISGANQIDCANYTYEWESSTLSCNEGKAQLTEAGNDEASLGQAYEKLDSNSASKDNISNTIVLIDKLNSDFEFEIVTKTLDKATITDTKQTNSYNKSILKAALDSK